MTRLAKFNNDFPVQWVVEALFVKIFFKVMFLHYDQLEQVTLTY